MAMSGAISRKRYILRALAILLALSGAAIFVLESHNFLFRSFGLLAVLASGQLVRMSRPQAPSFGRLELAGSNGPGRVMWSVAIGLSVLAAVSLWFLYTDALHGGRAVWPVYLFAGVGLACAGIWSCIVAQLVSRGR